jgi:hypothetical protein
MERVDARELQDRLSVFMLGQEEEMKITRIEAAFLVNAIEFYFSEGKL